MSLPTDPNQRRATFGEIWDMNFGFFGIQFGWGLQMANMSAIYQWLGAQESAIPLLWLAAPVTGLLVQPIIGHFSDLTWTRLGRRRPYFMGGAILAGIALAAMPNSPSLWVAALLLWVLDASINISMEPFRAFVGDKLAPEQRPLGYAMQSLLIGAGAVLSSALPWILARTLGLTGSGGQGVIPPAVQYAFYIGAIVLVASVLYTVLSTKETPPAPGAENGGGTALSFLPEIWRGLRQMPPTMRRLAVVQFFTWSGLFCMWIYFTPVVARRFFGGEPGSALYEQGAEWAGVCFSAYNGVALLVALGIVALGRRGFSARRLHRIGLTCAGAGLLSVGLWRDYHLLVLSMAAVGVGWATILSMPYALLANAIPADRMGFYMGAFNIFIVVPQILVAVLLGPAVSRLLHGDAFPIVLAGGGCMLAAAVALSWVDE